MAWIISKNEEVRRILVESCIRDGQDFTPDFPLASWIMSSKSHRLPNILLTLLVYLDCIV